MVCNWAAIRALESNLPNRWGHMCLEAVVAVDDYMIVAVCTDTNTFDWINYLCLSWLTHYYNQCYRMSDSLRTMAACHWVLNFHRSMENFDYREIHSTHDNSALIASIAQKSNHQINHGRIHSMLNRLTLHCMNLHQIWCLPPDCCCLHSRISCKTLILTPNLRYSNPFEMPFSHRSDGSKAFCSLSDALDQAID